MKSISTPAEASPNARRAPPAMRELPEFERVRAVSVDKVDQSQVWASARESMEFVPVAAVIPERATEDAAPPSRVSHVSEEVHALMV